MVITLPFGSFVPDQPPAPITVNAQLSSYADAGVSLPIQARGGFMFGADPLDNPSTDPPIQGSMTSANVTPSLFTLEKTYNGPEDETATGPDFPRRYTVTATIASGQTMSPFNLSDILPNNMQFVSLVSANPGGATCTHSNPAAPGGTLSCDFASVSGTVTMTFEYYIPLRDGSGGSVIDPASGDDALSCNNASGGGTWTPLDPRDTGGAFTQDPAGCEHTLTDKSIAIQKGVSVVGGGEPAPGSTLEYTHDFQVSDFFAFDGVVITDTISDGQHFDSSFVPTLQINGNTYVLAPANFNAANYDVTCNYTGGPGPECTADNPAANDGTTTLTFRVSNEIITRGQDGRLIGGCVPTGGTGGGDPDCGGYDDGPTTGRIVYRAVIQENFTDTYPSGDPSVDQGDVLDNAVNINGNVLSTSDASTPTGQTEADNSTAGVTIGRGALTKSIYAVNGSTSFSTPVHVSPGDTVTYRLRYTLPTSDFEDLVFTDYLPLPVFHATEVTTFLNAACGVPAAGTSCLGPADSYHLLSGAVTPTLSTNAADNWVRWTYGDYDSAANSPSTIDLLFTVTVTTDPFADGLYLTNQAQAQEGSTNSSSSTSTGIIQIVLDEPAVVNLSKGVVWTNNPSGAFTPPTVGPVTFNGTLGCPAWSGGNITSSGLAANPVNSNLSNVDAADQVMMAIVLENVGHASAFDVKVRDSLPAGMTYAPNSLCVTDGAGAAFIYLSGGLDGSGLFDADGIELVDPGPTITPPGALDPGLDSNNQVIDTGRNIAVITYLVTLDTAVQGGQILTNTATLFNYSNSEGGADFTAEDPSDTADTQIRYDGLGKTFTTEIINSYNSQTQVVIGEFVDYTLTLTFHEGTTPNVTLEDNLPSGLAFVDCLSITPSSSDLTTDLPGGFSAACNDPTNPNVSAPGQNFTFTLGTITNANTDNSVDETLTIVFRAVTLNVPGNQAGTNLINRATLRIDGGAGGTATVQSAAATVIEPTVNTAKSVLPTTADAGDTVTFTVTLSNPASGSTTAYDVTWSDTVPAGLTYVSGTLALGVCTASTPPTLSDAGAPTLSGSGGLFQPGESCTITFNATVDYSVTPGQVITNTAQTQWTSLPGAVTDRSPYNTDSDERTGADGLLNSGVLNDYRTEGQASVTINTIAPQKFLVATSEAHTGVVSGTERVTIGEIVRYRLVVQLPEGSSPNFQIQDFLPTGLIYLDDGTAKAAFVSNDAGIASSDYGTLPVPGITDPDCFLSGNSADGTNPSIPAACSPLADNNVGSTASASADVDNYTTGADPYFKLGTLTNNDSDADAEYVILEFNALVDNTATGSNDTGEDRVNNFRVFINGAQNGNPSNNITVRVAEPWLTFGKSASIDPTADAGDTVTYNLSITVAAGTDRSTVFDLVLTDAFDAYLTGLAVTNVTTTQGAACTGNGGGTTPFSHNGGTFAGNTLTFTASCLDPGRSIYITITGTVAASAPAGYVIPNTANTVWTSLPGPNGTTTNPTGSSTPGASGSDTGERDGSGTPAQNDYAASASANVTLSTPAVDKLDPSPTQYAIGQQVTFNILVTLPEGLTPALNVADNLPAGLRYVSHQVITTAAASGGILAADYNGTFTNDPPNFTCSGACASGDDITLDFGDAATAADNVTNNNAFLVQVVAVVVNEPGNQNGTTLTNTAAVTWTGGSASDSVNVTVSEPELDIAKTVDDTTPAYGQTLTYTLAISHLPTSTATAYDIVVTDTIPAGLTYVAGSISAPAGWTADDSAAPTLTWTCSAPCSLPVGNTASLTYQVTVNGPPGPPNPGDVLTNTASMTWTSTDGANPEERTGSGGINDYADSDPESVTLTAVDLQITKDDGGITTTAGGVVAYTLNYANAGNSAADGVVITETVPANATFNAGASTPGWSCADGSPAGTICTIAIGTLNPGASGSVTFAVTVDNPLPSGVTQIANTASIADDGAHGSDANPADNSDGDTTPIDAAPDLTITKDDGLTVVSPGQTLTYTLTISNVGTQDATGVVITDTLPADTTFVSASDGGTEAGGVVTWPAINLAAGDSVTRTVTIQVNDPFPGASILNQAHVQDDGSNGPDPTPADNDDDDTDSVLTLPSSDLTKSLIATNQGFTSGSSVAIGEILTYEIVFTVPAGGTMPNLTLTDTLDRGLAFVDCLSITPSSADITTTLPGGFAAACNDPTNPTVQTEPAGSTNPADPGRRITFTLGDVSNSGASNGTVAVQYTAVVLDTIENQDGLSLNNSAVLTWSSGSLAASAPNVTIVEPDFELTKEVDQTVALPGTVLTFTLTFRHTNLSNVDAFDVVLSDVLPPELTYVPGSLVIISGPAGGVPDDSAAPTLTVTWPTFPLLTGGTRTEAVVQFQATLGNLSPGQEVENTVSLAWTSLPGDVSAPQSPYNNTSTERYYDPLSAVNVYGVLASVTITVPQLPRTGFAPGVVTNIPPQPAEKAYTDLGDFWLEIPKLGLKMPIVGIPAKGEEWDLTWLWNQAGWLEGTAYPTHAGNSAITAHVYLPNGQPGPFLNLGSLRWGDQVIVHLGGQKYIYEVRQVRQVSPYSLSPLRHEEYPWLTLITCREYDEKAKDYRYRVVVRAVLTQIADE